MLTRVIRRKLGLVSLARVAVTTSRASSFFADVQDIPKHLLREASRSSDPSARQRWNDRLSDPGASQPRQPRVRGSNYGSQSTLPRTTDRRRATRPEAQHEIATILQGLADKPEDFKPTRDTYLEALRAAVDYSARRATTALAIGREVEAVDPEVELVNKSNAERAPEMTEIGKEGLGWKLTLGLYEDARAAGFDLGVEGLDLLLQAASPHPHLLHSLLLHMADLNLRPTSSTYSTLLRPALETQSIEQTILLFHEMQAREFKPTKEQITLAVSAACAWRMPRLAIGLIDLEERTALRPMDPEIWLEVLRCSAEEQFVDGVELAWQTLTATKFSPEEGLILAVLATAGKRGKPDLATSALSFLATLKVRAGEHHLAPLLEAFCSAGRVPEAITVLTTIREAGLEPTSATAAPLVNVLSQSAEILDEAFYALEDMVAQGETVDVTALNALIEASVRLGDLQRARATQAAAASLKIQPTIETYNLVLSACITANHRPLGDTLLTEMSNLDPPLEPNETTYERMVMLCLTQPTYEDAFYFLEQTKAASIIPRQTIYENLIRKCARVKDPRWKIALEEMEGLGYKASGDLMRYVQTGGADDPVKGRKQREEGGERRTRDRMVHDRRREFVAGTGSGGKERGGEGRRYGKGVDETSEQRAVRVSSQQE